MQFYKGLVAMATMAMIAVGMAAVQVVEKAESSCTCNQVTTITVPGTVVQTSTPGIGYSTSVTSSTVLVTATPSSSATVPGTVSGTSTPATPVIGSTTETVSLTKETTTFTGTATPSVSETSHTATEITTSGSSTETQHSHTVSESASESHLSTRPTVSPSSTSAPPTSAAASLPTGIFGMSGVLGGAMLVALVHNI